MNGYMVWRKFCGWVRDLRRRLAILIAGDDYAFIFIKPELPEKCIKRIVVSETLTRKVCRELGEDGIKRRLIKAAIELISAQSEYTTERVENGVKCEVEFYLLKKEDE